MLQLNLPYPPRGKTSLTALSTNHHLSFLLLFFFTLSSLRLFSSLLLLFHLALHVIRPIIVLERYLKPQRRLLCSVEDVSPTIHINLCQDLEGKKDPRKKNP